MVSKGSNCYTLLNEVSCDMVNYKFLRVTLHYPLFWGVGGGIPPKYAKEYFSRPLITIPQRVQKFTFIQKVWVKWGTSGTPCINSAWVYFSEKLCIRKGKILFGISNLRQIFKQNFSYQNKSLVSEEICNQTRLSTVRSLLVSRFSCIWYPST